jgi:3-oxoadipate enol-lactonase
MNRTCPASDGCVLAFRLHPIAAPGAPRIALIHSLALDSSIWDGVVSRLTDHAEVLVYDCRGHGRSERRAVPYSVGLFAGDLVSLMDHIGWPSATIAGCSMGGCVAQAFATNYPTRTQGLGLIDTTAWYGPKAQDEWQQRAEAVRSRGFVGLIEQQLMRWFSDKCLVAMPDAVRSLIEVFLANDVACYAASCDMLANADLRPYVGAFEVPTAVIVGENDEATPVEMSRVLHQAVRGSTLTILPGARHLTPVELPEDVATILKTLTGK